MLTQHRAQGRLRHLARGIHGIRDLENRLAGIDDAEIHHGIHFHRDVVASDHVLLRDIQHNDAQIHFAHLLKNGNDDNDARALDAGEAAQAQHHTALILVEHLDGS